MSNESKTESLSTRAAGIFFCLVGPTGSGKTSAARHIVNDLDKISFSISATSRPPRQNEVEGKDYYFIEREEFENKIAADEIFEYEEVHGNFYGTLRSTLEPVLLRQADLLLDIDIQGAKTFHTYYPEQTVTIFVSPPTLDELINRVTSRSKIDSAELKRRLQTAQTELEDLENSLKQSGSWVNYFVVNEDLDETVKIIKGILMSQRHSLRQRDEIQKFVQQFQTQLDQYMEK